MKWQTGHHWWSPSLDGGLAQRHTDVTGLEPILFSGIQPAPADNPLQNTAVQKWTSGPLLGASMRYRVGHLQIVPELRYTHWTKPAIGQTINFETGMGLAFGANPNEFSVLIGITLGKRSRVFEQK